jgi:hypothetical protein
MSEQTQTDNTDTIVKTPVNRSKVQVGFLLGDFFMQGDNRDRNYPNCGLQVAIDGENLFIGRVKPQRQILSKGGVFRCNTSVTCQLSQNWLPSKVNSLLTLEAEKSYRDTYFEKDYTCKDCKKVYETKKPDSCDCGKTDFVSNTTAREVEKGVFSTVADGETLVVTYTHTQSQNRITLTCLLSDLVEAIESVKNYDSRDSMHIDLDAILPDKAKSGRAKKVKSTENDLI